MLRCQPPGGLLSSALSVVIVVVGVTVDGVVIIIHRLWMKMETATGSLHTSLLCISEETSRRINVGAICIEVGHHVVLAYDLDNWSCIDGDWLKAKHQTCFIQACPGQN